MEKNYRAELTGVFGDPVDGNPTGVMEEAAYAAAGLNYRYITMRVTKENLFNAFKGAKAIGMRGLNLTMPHKIDILQYLDELSLAVKMIGAANTLINADGKWIGENTDGKGFVRSLELQNSSPFDKRIALLGAGGAARAIAAECAIAGAKEIVVINRDEARGQSVVEMVADNSDTDVSYLDWAPKMKIPEGIDIVINATPVGLYPNVEDCPNVDFDTITQDMTVCDVVFNPVMPEFLKRSAARGAKIITGIGMLVQQGALNFTLWTGEPAPVQVMYDTLAKEFGE